MAFIMFHEYSKEINLKLISSGSSTNNNNNTYICIYAFTYVRIHTHTDTHTRTCTHRHRLGLSDIIVLTIYRDFVIDYCYIMSVHYCH